MGVLGCHKTKGILTYISHLLEGYPRYSATDNFFPLPFFQEKEGHLPPLLLKLSHWVLKSIRVTGADMKGQDGDCLSTPVMRTFPWKARHLVYGTWCLSYFFFLTNEYLM